MTWFRRDFKIIPYTDSLPYTASIYDSCGHPGIDEVMRQYTDVFDEDLSNLGHCDIIPLTVNVDGHRPIRQRAYRTPLPKRNVVDEQVDEMLKAGVIQTSTSPWAAPVTLTPKKDSSYRFCIDYRKLNAVTVKDCYPLPLIQDIFDQLGGAKLFSTLDLKSGYWQIPVDPKDRQKTAFTCHRGLFEFNRMPFGLANAPAIFQRTMDKVLHGLIGVCCFVYIDDIIIYSRNAAEHAHHLKLVMDRLRAAGLKVKPGKCKIAQTEVKLLGYIVSTDGISSDPEKTRAIATMSAPTSVSEVRRFLGMTGYYRQTIPDYAKIAAPLITLTRKSINWDWGLVQQTAFKTLKNVLQSNHVLAYPQTNKPYGLYTDACDYAVGGILVQEGEDGVERVIQYVSHQRDPTQKRWATIEKEAYAIVYCLQKLRAYLWGARFTILTDHKPLRSLFQNEMANTKIQRWAVLIAEFGADIQYKEGRNNVRADMLSRLQIPHVASIVHKNYIEPQEGATSWSLPLDFDGIDKTALIEQQHRAFPEECQAAGDPDNEDYGFEDNVLFSTKRPGPRQAQYPRILLPPAWQATVIDRCHQQTGHAKEAKTGSAIREAYVWPGMRRSIEHQLSFCGTCHTHRTRPEHVAHGRMPDPCYPHQYVGMDLIGPFTRSERGHVYMFTLIDHLTGWADAFPISNKRGSTIADILNREYFPRYSPPEVLISDNGTEFVNAPVSDLCKTWGVERRTTTVYHPQSNGKVERFHRTFKGLIERLMSTNKSNWEGQLGPALAAYRTTVSTATGYSPFQALYGRRPRIPTTLATNPPLNPDVLQDDRIAILDRTWRGARAALASEREINEKRQERKKLADPLSLGDAVILLKPGLPVTFKPRWSARWEVIRARHPVYWIRHLPSGEEKVFNREKLWRVPDGVDRDMLPDTERQVDNTPTDDTPTPPKDTPSPAFQLPIPPPRNPTGEPPADVITAPATLPPADTHVPPPHTPTHVPPPPPHTPTREPPADGNTAWATPPSGTDQGQPMDIARDTSTDMDVGKQPQLRRSKRRRQQTSDNHFAGWRKESKRGRVACLRYTCF